MSEIYVTISIWKGLFVGYWSDVKAVSKSYDTKFDWLHILGTSWLRSKAAHALCNMQRKMSVWNTMIRSFNKQDELSLIERVMWRTISADIITIVILNHKTEYRKIMSITRNNVIGGRWFMNIFTNCEFDVGSGSRSISLYIFIFYCIRSKNEQISTKEHL